MVVLLTWFLLWIPAAVLRMVVVCFLTEKISTLFRAQDKLCHGNLYFQDEVQMSASEFFDMELRPNLQPGNIAFSPTFAMSRPPGPRRKESIMSQSMQDREISPSGKEFQPGMSLVPG